MGRKGGWVAIVAVLVLAACGGGDDDTVEGGTDTSSSGSSSTSSTTEPEGDGELLLRANGIGDLLFGAPADAVTGPMDAALGTPVVTTFDGEPIESGHFRSLLGSPEDLANSWIYDHPALHIRCYTNGMCLVLGGPSQDELAFTGWEYSANRYLYEANGGTEPAPDADPLATEEGITLGTRYVDFPDELDRDGEGCYVSAGLAVVEDGSIQVTYDDYVDDMDDTAAPAPDEELDIASMTAGAVMSYGDGCA